MSCHNPFRKFHVDVHLDRSLRIGHNKVNLAKVPSENDSKNDHEPYSKPCHNRSICLKIVHPVDLLPAVEVQSCLVRLDLVSCEMALAPHGPYRRYDLGVFRNFTLFSECPVVAVHVSIDFLDVSLCEFVSDCRSA